MDKQNVPKVEQIILSNYICDDVIRHCLLDYIYSNKSIVLKNWFDNYVIQTFETRFDQRCGQFKEVYYKLNEEYDDDIDYGENEKEFNEDSTLDELNNSIKETEEKIIPFLLKECSYKIITSSDKKDGCESVLHGEYKIYDRDNGLLKEFIEYDKGFISGKKYEYLDGVKPKIESYYSKGKLNGPYREYSRDGLIKESNYLDGVLHGEYKEYITFDNKKLVPYIVCTYKNGKYDGYYRINYKYGDNPYIECYYSEGKLNGSFKKYYDDSDYSVKSVDKIWCETNYKDDKLHGHHKEYNKDGSLHKEIDYIDGLIHGKYKEYKQGKLSLECDHIQGKKHGYLIDHINKQRGKFVNDIQVE